MAKSSTELSELRSRRVRLDAACYLVSQRLGIDPAEVLHDGTHVCLTVAQVKRLVDGPR